MRHQKGTLRKLGVLCASLFVIMAIVRSVQLNEQHKLSRNLLGKWRQNEPGVDCTWHFQADGSYQIFDLSKPNPGALRRSNVTGRYWVFPNRIHILCTNCGPESNIQSPPDPQSDLWIRSWDEKKLVVYGNYEGSAAILIKQAKD